MKRQQTMNGGKTAGNLRINAPATEHAARMPSGGMSSARYRAMYRAKKTAHLPRKNGTPLKRRRSPIILNGRASKYAW